LKEIDQGNMEVLYEHNIVVSDVKSAKALYAKHYFILSRFAAINDFQRGIRSISPKILENSSYANYFLKSNTKVKAKDVIDLLEYMQLSEPGSNDRLREDDAILELELLLANIEEDGNEHGITLSDFLVFVTCLDRIPAFSDFSKITVYFMNGNRLPEASTCTQTLKVPLINTNENMIKGVKLCTTFSAV